MKTKKFFRNVVICMVLNLGLYALPFPSCRMTEIPDYGPVSHKSSKKADKQAKADTAKHHGRNVLIFNDWN
jgi:hypothetical protein